MWVQSGAVRDGSKDWADDTSLIASLRKVSSAIRLHQWPKNLLVFVPLLISHEFGVTDLADAAIAFIAFCLLASATYIFNDLHDLRWDRLHASKSRRVFANGSLGKQTGIAMIGILLLASFLVARALPAEFSVALGFYLAGTLGYTLLFKRMLGLDIVALACLYVVRIVAGDEAIGPDLAGLDSSDWILGFSCLLFLSLAIIKRCSELSLMAPDNIAAMPGRAYRIEDIPVMLALAAGAAMGSIAIFVRYIGSTDVAAQFSHPRLLWPIVPILAYWLIRLILLANRRKIVDDPMIFTFRDRKSQLGGLAVIAFTLVAW